MDRTLLDTDVLSELMSGKNDHLNQIAKQYYRVYRCFPVSAITIAEVHAGIGYSQRESVRNAFESVLPLLEIVPFEAEEGVTAGRIMGALKANGRPIGAMDPLIAATAIERGLLLATGNVKHYQRVAEAGFELKLVDWTREA